MSTRLHDLADHGRKLVAPTDERLERVVEKRRLAAVREALGRR